MKNINLIYNSNGFLEEQYEDGNFYIAKEEDKALTFKATFPAFLVGSVRAYLQFRGGGDVVECGNININNHTVECAVEAKYLSYNFLKIGFEVVTANKEIRFEPVTLEVDEFVNIGGKSSAEGYTVTVKVGNVTKLAPGEEPYVANSGTAKDVVLNFGIPIGDKPEKGTDYFTAEEQQGFKADILADIDPVLSTKADKNNGSGGFVGGTDASANAGGAVGFYATANDGGAVGFYATSTAGGAVGCFAESSSGGAVGNDAYSEQGGAIGDNAKAGGGFSGGSNAIVGKDAEGNYIDAVQLGMGTNTNPKTLQIYNYTLMNNDGTIPEERLTKEKAYTDEKIGDIETALDTIIAMQNELTGGDSV